MAKILEVPAEAIKNSEEAVINIIASTVNNHDWSAFVFFYPTFNPIDKHMELVEENKKPYERLLQAEKDNNAY